MVKEASDPVYEYLLKDDPDIERRAEPLPPARSLKTFCYSHVAILVLCFSNLLFAGLWLERMANAPAKSQILYCASPPTIIVKVFVDREFSTRTRCY